MERTVERIVRETSLKSPRSLHRALRGAREGSTLERVNVILFDPSELTAPLPRGDPRARHLLEVLRRKVGDTFDAGVIDGPRGKGTMASIEPDALGLVFVWGPAPGPLDPIQILVAMPRPQTARDILRETTSLGVSALHFFRSEKGDASYGQSALWSTGEWRRHLIAGAAQAFDTRLPRVAHSESLSHLIGALPAKGARLALDNYEGGGPLGSTVLDLPVTLAFGPERGWSAAERIALRAAGFTLAHLGTRVLRCETAVITAIAVVRSKLNLI